MIKKENIVELLNLLNYSKRDDNLYYRQFDEDIIKVDISNEKIIYPDKLKVHDETTSNFKKNENFVVFECVNRLLNKGYRAKNIELEPRWQIGSGSSGGKADILVKDNNSHEFLIIECKTHGREYEMAWNKTELYGDQLFSYAQQVQHTQYLCLYTSDIQENKILYFNKIITIKDNEEYLKTFKPTQRKRFKDATTFQELHSVWKDIYRGDYETTGIFEDNIFPYEINKTYTVNDLKTISSYDSENKHKEFSKILRQHNVSSHENAFDKLVNVFLAKIVDEIQNEDGLQFYWRGTAYDDYYQLQDRLQKLYRDGMQKFLNEEITYIDNEELNDAFKFFKNDPDATKNIVMDYFRQIKFFTNNDFAFLDVHNEELFEQNSEILLKIVKMFQDVKLKTNEPNQFLGDLFENFLDDGIKQSEGQFFTPLPITRFIISSLPLDNIINKLDNPPKVIDYACGAGHFLNEYANQIKKYVPEEQLSDYYSNILGIEKEYRLSKVSKVSAFMYGQDQINIICADALANNPNIKNNSFDILIANPPYSVKGFLETLDDDERKNYELISSIGKNSYSKNDKIQLFFVERAKQLLKDEGVAGIILPPATLSNHEKIFIETRELILSNFDIISIVELPMKTFIATDTNTIILFLRKKKTNPSLFEHYNNRVDSWFDCKFDKDIIFEDKELLLEYLLKQNISFDDYFEFLNGNINDNLKNNFVFKQYLDKYPDNYEAIFNLEKDKLLFFMLMSSQPNDVFVVKAHDKNKDEREEYLGYKWKKTNERKGIFYLNAPNNADESISKDEKIKSIKTPLFNPNDLNDNNKINTVIKNNFENIEIDFDYDDSYYMKLTDMVDFSRAKFDKSVNLSINQVIELKSKYDVEFLGNICDIHIGGTPSRDDPSYFLGDNLWVSIGEMDGQVITDTKEKITEDAINDSNVKLIPKGTTLLSFKLTIGKTAIAGTNLYTNEAIAGLIPKNKDKVLNKYLFHLFNTNLLDSSSVGYKSFGKSLNSSYLKDHVQIPVPPMNIQKEIIDQCDEIDIECNKFKMKIKEYEERIEELFANGRQLSNNTFKLNDSTRFKLGIGNRVLTTELVENGLIDVISANVNESFGKINEEIINDYSTQYILWGIDGDWMVRTTDVGEKFYPTDHCGYIQVVDNEINPKYLAKIIETEGRNLRFSRSFRASIERVSNITVSLPNNEEQNKLINKVIELENKIFELETTLADLNLKKEDIVNTTLEIEFNRIS